MSTFFIPEKSEFVEANGVHFAYRKFGKETGTPLVCLVHFRGTMENWDPELMGRLAADRPVIIFDNTGIGESSGETPSTVAQMAKDAASFISALGLKQVDILGFSLGGFVAQELVMQHPDLIRRVILAGTAPRSGTGLRSRNDVREASTGNIEDADSASEQFLFLFYRPTETSRARGIASLKRIFGQKKFNSSLQVLKAQSEAIAEWAKQGSDQSYKWLNNITHPVLVTNGIDDVMVPTENSYILSQHLPNAQLIIYPDSGHGHLFQYPHLFAEHAKLFLDV